MRNICLTLAYDGTSYHGFQRQPQPHGPTIQGTLERVWESLVGEKIQVHTAGRTDTGVHAKGQVVNFQSETRIPEEKIPKAFNSLLPRDIRILSALNERPEFHSRFSARWKRYDYLIDNRPVPDVFQRLYALHEPLPLRREAMAEAADLLEGKHDFRAFAAAGGTSKTFERTLYVCRVAEGENGLLSVTCAADGFLYHMVRILVGTLLEVGRGKIPVERVEGILAGRERKEAGETAPAHGLTLVHVHYGEELPREVFPDLRRGKGKKDR
ncbi:tRNA pseudouridine38-40 synthase [Acididesulfobacillus acetoxydans]|uniref:tRNA pseudouridine synthase A n=1 Tax=Acididesulfobacillus acetoxydans TaxID=1561005 RepID=A0A8S0VVW8_9FIRM|nr:tRNA pseudouridine(38-40) synthase TruA [Acididesulfobacillus acetoxydans]CAA7600173.1 tRNA pseudouridine38-40 synthase [Acididesulfobacillus acetoxydans]CEJ09551.1 tRNA pseudouridine synthase A [Acididesulfobacillus acetoxydans]